MPFQTTTQDGDVDRVIGKTLYGAGGEKIGMISRVYFHDVTKRPVWVTVYTGFFSTKESFVPVGDACSDAKGIRVPYRKDAIKEAPNVDVNRGHLSEQEERQLMRHYWLVASEGRLMSDVGQQPEPPMEDQTAPASPGAPARTHAWTGSRQGRARGC